MSKWDPEFLHADAVTVSAWVNHTSTVDWDDIIAGGCEYII